MYGPAVRRKRFSSIWRICGLASMYPASDWSELCSGPPWISARVRSHYRTGLSGPNGSPVFARAGKTDPPSRLILSQTSAGNRCWGYVMILLISRSSFVRAEGRLFLRPGQRLGPRARRDTQADRDVISSVLAYSNSRSLLRTAQAIRASLLASAIASTLWCSRFLAASIQGLSPWRSQVFGLIGAEVAPLGEHRTIADRGHHRARDDRSHAGHGHQPLACHILTGQRFDLGGQALDALVKPVPIASEFLDRPQHARREDIGARGEDLRELGPQAGPGGLQCRAPAGRRGSG